MPHKGKPLGTKNPYRAPTSETSDRAITNLLPRDRPVDISPGGLSAPVPTRSRRRTPSPITTGGGNTLFPLPSPPIRPRDGGRPSPLPPYTPPPEGQGPSIFTEALPGHGGLFGGGVDRKRQRSEEAEELGLETLRQGVEGRRLDLLSKLQEYRARDPANLRRQAERFQMGGPSALRAEVGEVERERPSRPAFFDEQARADTLMARQREEAREDIRRAEDLAFREREFGERGRQFNIGESARQQELAEDIRRFNLLRGDVVGGGSDAEELAAEAAAFGRAKEQTGDIAQGALTALTDELSRRGFGEAGGGGGEALARANVIASGARDLSNVAREQAIQRLARRERLATQRQAGLRALTTGLGR